MSRVLDALHAHACSTPARIAIDDGTRRLGFAELERQAERLAQRLFALAPAALGILADNGIGWVLTDLAAMIADIPVVPLPPFASPSQIEHAVRAAGIEYVVTDRHAQLCAALPAARQVTLSAFDAGLFIVGVGHVDAAAALPPATWKITFTSGTTASPKGVCLSRERLEITADALRIASGGRESDRHLVVLPLATLLENVGGIYAPLLAGATILVPPPAAAGLSGSSSFDVAALVRSLGESGATSAIVVPEMLRALVARLGATGERLPKLRFLAVGGGHSARATIERARALGLPVFEGYGLSECGSVVTLNTVCRDRPGSVGTPLPHVDVAIGDGGEILVSGSAALGYLGGAPFHDPIATGDIGHFDADGYLHVDGRRDHVIVTSFGRNVSPEWIEGELEAHPAIARAAVFGERRPFLCAVVATRDSIPDAAIDAAIEATHRTLPDYARVRGWVRASTPFTARNGLATANGRLRRTAIRELYAAQIATLYEFERADPY